MYGKNCTQDANILSTLAPTVAVCIEKLGQFSAQKYNQLTTKF